MALGEQVTGSLQLLHAWLRLGSVYALLIASHGSLLSESAIGAELAAGGRDGAWVDILCSLLAHRSVCRATL